MPPARRKKPKYPNSGAVWKNQRKKTAAHPDYTGQGVLKCPHCQKQIELWLSSWVKNSRVGLFLSVAFTPKDPAVGPTPAERATIGENYEDMGPLEGDNGDKEIPF